MIYSNKIRSFAYPAYLIAGFFIIFLSSGCTSSKEKVSKKIVLKVNEDTLSLGEFANRLARELKGLDALTAKDKNTIQRAKKSVIRDFITNSLSFKWAKNNDLFVRKENLEAEITTIRNFYPDDLSFRRALANEGISFSEWKAKLRYSLLQKMLIKKISANMVPPSDSELNSYYNRHSEQFKEPKMVRITQIVLEKEIDAERIVVELRKGKQLSKLAKKFSIAPEASENGDIGWIEKGTLGIYNRAFSMKVGRRSDIIKSPYGYHIFKVTGKKKARKLSFQSVKERIRQMAIEKREQAIYASWLEKQIRISHVFKDEELISSVSVVTRSK